MKKFVLSLAMAGSLSAPMVGCTQTEAQNAAIGAAGGAVAGQLIGGNTESTVAGAVIGATAGVLLARRDDGRCVYRNSRGQRYVAACP